MGWEQRGANQYYYRKERQGSRVKSTYVGRGEIAHFISDSNVVKGSITLLTLGLYMEKRLSMAQRRFTRACETLTRVKRWSRNTPALQVNIAAAGGKQLNVLE
jgi:hypothetical protein